MRRFENIERTRKLKLDTIRIGNTGKTQHTITSLPMQQGKHGCFFCLLHGIKDWLAQDSPA